MLIRQAFVEGEGAAKRWLVVILPIAMIAGVVFGAAFSPRPEFAEADVTPLALCVANILPIPLFIRVLSAKPAPGRVLLYPGKISYSMDLFQAVWLVLIARLISPGDWPLAFLAGVFAATIAHSLVPYRYIERPMIDFGRALAPARRIEAI